MTAADLIANLMVIFDREAPGIDFNITECLSYLNRSQRYVAGELPIRYVRPLETVSSAKPVSVTGGISLSMQVALTYAALGAPAATGFVGDDGQGLSLVNDAYKGAVIYSVGYGSYHVVTAYVGASRTFTVSPAASGNFGASETKEFYFVTPDYGFGSPILNGDRGIIAVLHSSGKYCTELPESDRRIVDQESMSIPESNPRYFIEGTTLYLRPYTYGTTTGIIYYKRVPAAITSSVACVLDDNIQDIITDYAGFLGLNRAKQYSAAADLYALAEKRINTLINKGAKLQPVRMEASLLNKRSAGANIFTLGYDR